MILSIVLSDEKDVWYVDPDSKVCKEEDIQNTMCICIHRLPHRRNKSFYLQEIHHPVMFADNPPSEESTPEHNH